MRRSDYLVWHRRLAILFAPLLLLQALTGGALLFREPLGRLLEVMPSTGALLPVDRLFTAAAATGKHVDRLQLPTRQGRAVLVHLTDAKGVRSFATIDPVSAQILREGGVADFPLEAALQLHYQLLVGTTGLLIVTLNGIALLFMAGTGLVFWWPRKGRWGKSLAINPKMPARVRLRHWHRSFGVVAAVLIGCSGATGMLLSGNDLLAALPAQPVTPGASDQQGPPRAAHVRAGMQLAQDVFPGAKVRDLRFKQGAVMEVNLLAPERNSQAVHIVRIDLAALRIVRVTPAQDNPALWMKLLPYHSGDEFGLVGQLVLLVEALVLIGLGISGPLMWWQQRKLRK